MKFTSMQQFADELLRWQENVVLEQLNALISKGSLVVTKGPATLVHDAATDNIEVRQMVQLELKDQERMNELEAENQRLKARLSCVEEAFKNEGTNHG